MKTIAMAVISMPASNNRDRMVVIFLLVASFPVSDSCMPPCQPGYVCCDDGFCAFSRCTGGYCVVSSQCSSGESCCNSECIDSLDCSGQSCSYDYDCDGESCCTGTCTIGSCNCVQDSECPDGEHCCDGDCSSDDCPTTNTQNSQQGKNTLATVLLTFGFIIFLCMIAIFAYVECRGRRKSPLSWRLAFARHHETGKDVVLINSSQGILASSDAVSSQGTSAD